MKRGNKNRTGNEMKRKGGGYNRVSGAGTANEKTEREPRALLHPDPLLSVAACGASKVKVCACACVRECWGRGGLQCKTKNN